MADEIDAEDTEGSEGMAALRKQLRAVTEERDRFRTSVQQQAIRDAGLDPELGIVRRLAADYAGEWTPKAFADYARAEGLPIAPAQTPEQQLPVAPPAAVTSLTEAEQLRLAGQTRLDALGALSRPDETPSLRGQIDAQEAKAIDSKDPLDWQKAFQLKNTWADEIGERARQT